MINDYFVKASFLQPPQTPLILNLTHKFNAICKVDLERSNEAIVGKNWNLKCTTKHGSRVSYIGHTWFTAFNKRSAVNQWVSFPDQLHEVVQLLVSSSSNAPLGWGS